MKKITLLTISFLIGLNVFSQINLNDSTVSFVAYWNLNETQLYHINQMKYKIKDNDTVSVEKFGYDYELTVLDSTESSYVLKWTYKNLSYETDNLFMKKLMSISENLSVIYKTDELGAFWEVINHEEIKQYIDNAIDTLKHEFGSLPNINPILEQVRSIFTSKEAIESAAIREIIQFHSPYGSKYEFNTVYNGKTQMMNIYGGEPFDADLEIELFHVDTENSTAVVRIFTTVDPEQATNASYQFIKQMAESTNTPVPDRNQIPTVSLQDRFASNIHTPTGWVIDAVNVRETTAENQINIERTEYDIILK